MAKIFSGATLALLRDLHQLTGRQFIYDDPWHGFVPMEGPPEKYQTGPPTPFARLAYRDKADVLRSFMSWEKRGIGDRDQDTIVRNIANGKSSSQWLEGTSLLDTDKPHPIVQEASLFESTRTQALEPSALEPGAAKVDKSGDHLAAELAALLQTAERFCVQGIGCGNPGRTEAALHAVLGKIRAALAAIENQLPPQPHKDQSKSREW